MPLDKPCLAPGCRAEGCHGFGSLRRGTMIWACPAHRDLLIAATEGVPQPPSRRAGGDPRSPAVQTVSGPAQGRLFG